MRYPDWSLPEVAKKVEQPPTLKGLDGSTLNGSTLLPCALDLDCMEEVYSLVCTDTFPNTNIQECDKPWGSADSCIPCALHLMWMVAVQIKVKR